MVRGEIINAEIQCCNVIFLMLCYIIGQVIDGPMNGRAPGAWEMQVEQPAPFAPTTLYQEIPHTASVHVRLCFFFIVFTPFLTILWHPLRHSSIIH